MRLVWSSLSFLHDDGNLEFWPVVAAVAPSAYMYLGRRISKGRAAKSAARCRNNFASARTLIQLGHSYATYQLCEYPFYSLKPRVT